MASGARTKTDATIMARLRFEEIQRRTEHHDAMVVAL
jgi:hypothetical protein